MRLSVENMSAAAKDGGEHLDVIENTTKHRSEIVAPKDRGGSKEMVEAVREVTFDDLFRERFIPLDSRKKVGDYIIGKIIGEGSFSKVREARNIHNNEKCAVKVLPKKTILKRQDVKRRFIREVRSLRNISHPNVVSLHEVMETTGNYYLVMDLVKGDNFREFLRKRNLLPENEAKIYLSQMADAVNYMHGRKIVHRDLKPENCIVSNEILKIVDFGLSASIKHADTMTTQCGSPAYAAPEVFTKQPYTKQVDVWSMGTILYLTVTGSLPFQFTSTHASHLHPSVQKVLTFPDSISLTSECQELLRQMLHVNPDLRIKSQDVLKHVWFSDHFKTSHLKQ